MGMRAGSYNVAAPQWRGVIRDDSYPAYVHTNHATQPDATACARAALATLKAPGSGGVLPAGWIRYQPATPA
jgi:hypothetical protein